MQKHQVILAEMLTGKAGFTNALPLNFTKLLDCNLFTEVHTNTYAF